MTHRLTNLLHRSASATQTFTVIIPTLQRSSQLGAIVAQCARHPLVSEVLVINNAQSPLTFPEVNVRVLNQPSNIFVNPAWNLGVRESRTQWIALINDDVRFLDEALDHSAKILRHGLFAIVGPDKTCFQGEQKKSISHRIAQFNTTIFGFGTFMCMRKVDYIPIPGKMPIWGGDDWLFSLQHRPNAVLVHTEFHTEGSTTVSAPEFAAIREEQQAVCAQILAPIVHSRWWHRPVEWLAWARGTRYRLLTQLRGM